MDTNLADSALPAVRNIPQLFLIKFILMKPLVDLDSRQVTACYQRNHVAGILTRVGAQMAS